MPHKLHPLCDGPSPLLLASASLTSVAEELTLPALQRKGCRDEDGRGKKEGGNQAKRKEEKDK